MVTGFALRRRHTFETTSPETLFPERTDLSLIPVSGSNRHSSTFDNFESVPLYMSPKLINGKVWIHVGSLFGGGYQKLPENDPKYKEIFLWIDSQRFVELLDWVYNQRTRKKAI